MWALEYRVTVGKRIIGKELQSQGKRITGEKCKHTEEDLTE